MQKRLTRTGNSHALVLDKGILEATGIDSDTILEVSTDGDVILGLETRKRGGPYATFVQAAPFPGRLDNVTVEVETILAEDDQVAIQSLICGDHAAELLDFEPTGQRLCSRYLNLYTLKDGRIVSNAVGVHRDQLREQLEANAQD